jgi:hypothetical protein
MPSITIDTNVDINASRAAVWDVLTAGGLGQGGNVERHEPLPLRLG